MLKGFSGLAISCCIAVVAISLSYVHPTFEALVISIILGMLIANILEDRSLLEKGLDLSIKIFLPVGIALYGTQLIVEKTDTLLVFSVLVTYILIFFSVYFMSLFFNLRKNTSILLATGMSTCGASAIAILSPLINADSEETSISLIAVMIYGLFGMIFYPLLSDLIGLGIKEFAFLSGTTLPMLGQVKVSASALGTDCLNQAVKYKLLRMSFLVFLITFAVFLSRGKKGIFVPWFVILFIVLAVSVNVFKLYRLSKLVEPLSRFSLSIALASIGMKVHFDSITESGIKPVAVIFISLSIVLAALYMVYYIFFI
ncbi:hypothetical protein BMS3Bbin06_01041 [bacterium BMS3Bbin06]|nr:hypothetical protein BMS3Abin08_00492 [bacterium BMS3Abin08]GBE34515.1 hypothetical protein BMS3Bbin06_01041 [bacterium BMS3Bbin06]HDO34997.1 putative sulfate exporter family transporter [Nitrospirota bacterium]HDY72363.1 putative sulfate exporter family transporter [Nitrospirota bacterium]